MKGELQKQLFKKYPKIFDQKDLPMSQTCMCWGIDCGDGWYWILDMLCGNIQSYCTNRNKGVRIRNKARTKKLPDGLGYIGKEKEDEEEWQVETTQVKEKYGGLRFYINGGDDEVYGMISLAEHMSYNTCEECGSIKNIQQTKSWIKSLCPKCMKKLKKE